MNRHADIPMTQKAVANRIPALEKAIRVLQLLAGEGKGLPSKAIAVNVGASASTCYRILKTLEVAGWVVQDDYGGFRLGSGLLPLVDPLSELREITRLAQPLLHELARDLSITAKLCARQGRDQITIAAGLPSKPVGILAPVGIPYPVIEAVSGAALLSNLRQKELDDLVEHTPPEHWRRHKPNELRERVAQCHQQGWCQNIGSHPQGIDAIACPVRMGTHWMALCFIGFRGDFHEKALPRLHRQLMESKRKLESATLVLKANHEKCQYALS